MGAFSIVPYDVTHRSQHTTKRKKRPMQSDFQIMTRVFIHTSVLYTKVRALLTNIRHASPPSTRFCSGPQRSTSIFVEVLSPSVRQSSSVLAHQRSCPKVICHATSAGSERETNTCGSRLWGSLCVSSAVTVMYAKMAGCRESSGSATPALPWLEDDAGGLTILDTFHDGSSPELRRTGAMTPGTAAARVRSCPTQREPLHRLSCRNTQDEVRDLVYVSMVR